MRITLSNINIYYIPDLTENVFLSANSWSASEMYSELENTASHALHLHPYKGCDRYAEIGVTLCFKYLDVKKKTIKVQVHVYFQKGQSPMKYTLLRYKFPLRDHLIYIVLYRFFLYHVYQNLINLVLSIKLVTCLSLDLVWRLLLFNNLFSRYSIFVSPTSFSMNSVSYVRLSILLGYKHE